MPVPSSELHETVASNDSCESSHQTPEAPPQSSARNLTSEHADNGFSSVGVEGGDPSISHAQSSSPPSELTISSIACPKKYPDLKLSPAVTIRAPPPQKLDVSTPPQKGESSEVTSEDEEYFEEFLLPNTGENAFVRHQSFRRKVQLTEIDAPDAERIEGLVRTGDFHRHGSIRKKIVPEESVFHELDEEFDTGSSVFAESLSKNIEDIQNLIDATDDSLSEINDHGLSPSRGINPSHASTPYIRNGSFDLPSQNSPLVDVSLVDSDNNIASEIDFALQLSSSGDESLSIEQSTLKKIKDCLDYSNYNDIYNLSGRLQDILSPREIEEVLNNSERYSELINFEVMEVLSMSLHENSKGNDTCNTDSGFSSPKPPELGKVPENKSSHSPTVPSSSEPGFLEEGVDPDEQVPNKLKKIPAPVIDLDSSSDVEHDPYLDESIETSELSLSNLPLDSSTTEDSSPECRKTQKKKVTFNKSFLSSIDEHSSDFISSDLDGADDQQPSPPIEIGIEAFPPDGGQKEEPPFSECVPPPPPPDLIPELTAAEEFAEERHWRNVVIGGSWRRIDMKVIAPYRKCITHGGYNEENKIPIIVLSSSLLPEKSKKDYHYVMDNLFMYVLSYLEHLVSDDYVLVYLAGGRNKEREPGFHWMRKAYQMIDRRLRKNLKQLLVVHPTIWARTLIALSRPFISSKFYRKLRFVYNLTELAQLIPLEQIEIPEAVKQVDFELMIKEKKRNHANKR